MSPTRAIFDLDGTLADTMPVHFRAWQDVAARHGLVFPEPRFYSLGGVPTITIARTLVEEQGLAVDPRLLATEKEAAFLARFDEIGPIHAVVAIARRFAEAAPVAIATGGRREVAERTIAKVGLEGLFAVVVTAEDTARHKPEPDVFLEAARRLGAAPGDCAVYEDTELGLEAARRAGMTPVDVRPLYARAGAAT
jgi:beta-phosphoglucomutase-like phosphatase (HAD superfamily)